MRNNQKGFTLVELLVVIAIIAILAGVVLIAINPAAMTAKARDSQRLTDIDNINKAIGLALAENEIVLTDTTGGCATCTSATGTQVADGENGWIKFTLPDGKTGLSKYLAALPIDPTNDAALDLVYTFGSDGTNYELNAVLESADYTDKMINDGGSDDAVFEAGTSLTIL